MHLLKRFRLASALSLGAMMLTAACDARQPTSIGSVSLVDSIVVRRLKFSDSTADTVTAAVPLAIYLFPHDGASLLGVELHLRAEGGSTVDQDSVRLAGSTAVRVQWTLGVRPGPQRLTASVGERLATFSIATHAGHPDTLLMSDSLPTRLRVGDTVTFPSIQVADRLGNPVRSPPVLVLVVAGGAEAVLHPISSGILAPSASDSNGVVTLPRAIVTAKAGTGNIVYTWTAAVPFSVRDSLGNGSAGTMGISGTRSQPVVFVAGPPAQIVPGWPQLTAIFAAPGSTYIALLTITDVGGNPLPNVAVSDSVVSGGGTAPASVVSDANGVAHVPFTTGPLRGANTIHFYAPWLPVCEPPIPCHQLTVFTF